MAAKNPPRASDRVVDVEQSMAVIEKGQQLAGHFPSADALDSARRILTGELSPEDAELELNAALVQIVKRARSASEGQ